MLQHVREVGQLRDQIRNLPLRRYAPGSWSGSGTRGHCFAEVCEIAKLRPGCRMEARGV